MRHSASAQPAWPSDPEAGWDHLEPSLPRIGLLVPPGSASRQWDELSGSAGMAVALRLSHGESAAALEDAGRLDALLVDLRGAGDWAETAQALGVRRLLEGRRAICALVITDLAGLEPALATIDGLADVEWLCAPDAVELAAGLALLAHRARHRHAATVVREDPGESDRARMEALSAEMRRLTEVIERLTTVAPGGRGDGLMHDRKRDYGAHAADIGGDGAGLAPRRGGSTTLTAPALQSVLRARRLRDRFFAGDLFADPGWDIILDLMLARMNGERVSVSSLCIAAAVPPTTALRWIRQLTERGVVRRIDDAADGRRVFIELADETARAVESWWAAATDKRAAGLAGV